MRNITQFLIAALALLPASAHADEIVGGDGHYYHIVWHKTPSLFLTETSSGVLQVEDQSNTARQYWQFVPTENANCFYLKNAVTGHYIEACKTAKDNTYNIGTTSTPVEYYIASEPAFDGAYRFTSTNCANYTDTSKTPVGLNKSGSTSYIITWDAGTGNAGSFWDILPTQYDYDAEAVQEQGQHSAYAKSAQVYFMPCGSHYSSYLVRKLHVDGDVVKDLDYPCATWGGSTKKAATPVTNTWWTLFTTDKGMLKAGGNITVDITLGKALPEGYLAQLCFDWDRDGVFEDVKTIDNPLSKTLAYEVKVPADARLGQSRMRFRLTDNGIDDPDGDVTAGQILDCLVETVAFDRQFNPETDLQVSVNDPKRGYVENAITTEGDATHVSLTARPYGNARFLCWLEGRKVVGTLPAYQFDLVRPCHLVAMFSVNTKEEVEGIPAISVEDESQPYPHPVYYDLSGRLVEHPVSGETYIRKDSPAKGSVVIF